MKLLPILLCLVLIGCSSNATSRSGAPSRSQVCRAAHELVKDGLKSPGSAQFQSCDQETVSGGPMLWNVSGYVDSQNGFGALLRSNYRITINYVGGGKWTRESLDFQ